MRLRHLLSVFQACRGMGSHSSPYGSACYWLQVLLLLVGSALLGGCGSLLGGLDVRAVGTSFEAPSNVAVYLAVSDGEQPVTDLTPANFAIHENGKLLDGRTTRQTLLPRELVAVHKTLLLVDVSAANDTATKRSLVRAIEGFVARVRRNQAVEVYLFDGRSKIERVGAFLPLDGEGQGTQPAVEIDDIAPADPSRDLYGALISGSEQLSQLLASSKKPVRVGSLVFFSWGPDLAGRTTDREIYHVLEATPHHVFAIGMEGDEQPDWAPLARSGVVKAASGATLGIAFEEMAAKVIQTANQYYLISYCSPARAGERRLRVEVNMTTVEGDDRRGFWETDFSATGFGPGCDPQSPPGFMVAVGATTPSAPGASQAEAPVASETSPAATGEQPEVSTGQAPPPEPEGEPAVDSDGEVVPPPADDSYAPVD